MTIRAVLFDWGDPERPETFCQRIARYGILEMPNGTERLLFRIESRVMRCLSLVAHQFTFLSLAFAPLSQQ